MNRIDTSFLRCAFVAASLLCCTGLRAAVDDFESKPPLSVWEAEKSGAAVTFEAAPADAKGLSAKVAWSKAPPKGVLRLIYADGSRPELPLTEGSDSGGVLQFSVFTEQPGVVRRFEGRVKDAKGESFTWTTDAMLKGKQWEPVTITMKPGTESSRRGDKPTSENGKLDLPVRLVQISVIVTSEAESGSLFIDDVEFVGTVVPATQPAK